jgi:hypothetical protein
VSPRAEGRYALVVATAQYSDPKLQLLRAPAADAEHLGAVLSDPARGDFDVEVLLDSSYAKLTRAIASFFRDRRPQDLLLLHFSCHGVKDDRGDLYLAAADTEVDLLSATGVSATWLSEQIDRSRSRRTCVLLDCCFSGSFPFGMRSRGRGVDAPEQLQGTGRVIITASNAMEYAYEGDQLVEGESEPSIFTGAIIEGIESGNADLDRDQLISVDDLYNYVYDRVKEATPSQTPLKKSELEGPLYLARSVYRADASSPLDSELLDATRDRYAGIREGAVQELARLLASGDPEVAEAARHALLGMTDDDSEQVARAARAALAGPAPPEPAPPPRRRRWWVAIPLVAAALAVAAVVVLNGDNGGEALPQGNVVSNPSFESDTAGWTTDEGTIESVAADDAPDGRRVVTVTSLTPGHTYSIDDRPNSIQDTVKGRAYTVSAWVKAAPATDGKAVCLVLRERATDAERGGTQATVNATAGEYRRISLNYVTKADHDNIGIHLFGNAENAGDGFLADAITISPASGVTDTPESCPL